MKISDDEQLLRQRNKELELNLQYSEQLRENHPRELESAKLSNELIFEEVNFLWFHKIFMMMLYQSVFV